MEDEGRRGQSGLRFYRGHPGSPLAHLGLAFIEQQQCHYFLLIL